MKKTYKQKLASSRGNFVKSFLALAYLCLMLFTGNNAWGQVSLYSFAQSTGTYTEITGGTSLVLSTGGAYADSGDDLVWPITGLPFNFNYNGTNYTSVNVSSNGFITFGTTAPATGNYTPISGTAGYSGAISAWGADLNGAFVSGVVAGEVRWQVVGSAPSRELVIQYKNWRPYRNTSVTEVPYMNFQIRLAETSNTIKVVYGATGVAAGTTTLANTSQIGLRGSSNSDYNNRTNATTVAFTSSTAGGANNATQAFSYATGAAQGLPSNGLTYAWTPPSCFSPTAIIASAITPATATISWTAPASAPASGYEYEIRTSGAAGSGATGLFLASTTAAGVTTANLTGLTAGTTYSIYVRGNCGTGNFGNWTTAVTFTPSCAIPTAVTTSAIMSSTATIAWTEPTPASASGYEYEIRTSGAAGSGATGLFLASSTAAGIATANLTGLTNNTTYQVYVRANCGGGNFSAWTSSVSFTTLCRIPTVVTVSAVLSATATISWTAPTPASASGYQYEIRTSGAAGSGATGLFFAGTTAAGVTTANITGLNSGTAYNVYVRGNCGSGDFSNWTTVVTFATVCTAESIPTVSQGFEGAAVPVCWATAQITGTTAWASDDANDAVTAAHSGATFMGKNYNTSDAIIASQPINFTTAATGSRMNVWIYRSSSNIAGDRIRFHVNATPNLTGATQLLEIFPLTTAAPAVTASGWYNYIVNIPASFNSLTTGYIIAQGTTSGGLSSYGLGFDDFKVEAIPSCLEPGTPVIAPFTATTATITWTASPSAPASGYEYEVRASGAAGSGATGLTFSGTTLAGVLTGNATGLADATTYSVYVRANCGAGDFSAWTPAATFTTLCLSTNVPYLQDFESVTVPALPVCTSVENAGTGNVWQTVTGASNGFSGKYLRYTYNSSNAANTWFYTKGINLTAGTSYRISYNYGSAGYNEKLKVAYGTSAAAASMTNLIEDHGTVNTTTALFYREDFTPTVSGVYYFGFQAYSASNLLYLHVDNIQVVLSPTCLEAGNPVVSAVATTTATITWTASASAPASGYEYEIRTSGAAGSGATGLAFSGTTAAGVLTANLTGLVNGTAYSVYVRANCGAGDFSPWSSVATFTTSCKIPTALTVTAASATSANASWTAPSPASASGYEYEVRTSGAAGSGATGLFFAGTTAAGVTTAAITGLTSGTTYSVYVRGNCGSGDFSNWTSAVTVTPTCVRPTGVAASAITPNTATISWNASVPATENGYEYEIRTSGAAGSGATGLFFAGTTAAGVTTANITGLTSGTTYSIYVRGNCGGFSTWTNAVTFVPTCVRPTAVTATGITPTSANISWTEPTPASASGYEYEVRTSGAAGSGATGLIASGTTLAGVATASIPGLVDATTYTIYVRANCGAGSFSTWTTGVTFTTGCKTPSVAVVSAITTNTATITWTNATGAPASGYEYEIRTSGAAGSGATGLFFAGTTGPGVLTANITGMTDATTYTVYVRANCGSASFSAWTAATNFNTVCLPTNVPYLLDFEEITPPAFPICTSIENAGTGNNWVTSNTVLSGFTTKYLRYAYNSSNAANAWFYTRAINLTAGTSYRISYKYGTSSTSSVEKMKVAYGTTASAAGMTIVIEDHPSIVNGTPIAFQEDFIPAVSGVYYFGFNAYSTANQYSLLVDDIKIIVTPTCFIPTSIVASAITTNSATITWTASTSTPSEGYEYEIRTSGAAGSGATGLVTSGTTAAGVVTKNITALSSNTVYNVYIRSNCGSGDLSEWAPASFTTLCAPELAPTVTEGFASYTGAVPAGCWSEGTGTFGTTSTMTVGDGKWRSSTGFANTGTDKGAIINLYSTNTDWLISNQIDLGTSANFRVKYKMAVTSYDGTTAQTTLGTHKVSLVISTDGGTTWSSANTLKSYTGVGTYSNTGQIETVNVNTYTGIVKFAFVAATTSTSPDIHFHIDDFVVELIPAPTITNFASTVACGQSTALTITGTELAGASVTINGTPVTVTTNTATQITATVSSALTGPIVVTTGGGTATSATNFTFAVSPALTLSGATTTICAGAPSAAITVTAGGADYTTYTWTPSTGVTGNETTGWTFNPTSTTAYTLAVSGATGCVNTAQLSVIANPLPSALTITPDNADACVNTVLALNTTGGLLQNVPIFAEDFNGTAAGWVTGNSTTGSNAAATGWTLRPEGYTVAGTSTYGPWSSNDDSQFMLTNADPGGSGSITYTTLTSPSFSTTNYQAAKLNFYHHYRYNNTNDSSMVYYSVNNGTTWTRFYLTNTANVGAYETFANADIALPAGALNQSNVKIRFVFRSAWGYTWAIDNVKVTGDLPTELTWSPATNLYTDAAATTAYVAGANASTVYVKTATPGPLTYTATAMNVGTGCSVTDVANVTVHALPAAPTITAGGALAFCAGDEVVLTSSAATGNVWSNTETTNAITVSAAGSYTVKTTDAFGCTSAASAPTVVTVNALPTVNAGADVQLCAGNAVTLTASGTALTPTWNNSVVNGVAFTPTATGTYTVTVTDANSCSGQDAVLVTVNALPTVNAGADQTVCSGTPVTLTASGTALTPTWSNGVVNGVAFTPAATTTYTVVVIDANNCTGQDAVLITVNAAPNAVATISGNVTITATPAGQTYQWVNCATNAPIAGATNATFTATANGSYKVIVTNASGCASTSSCVNITKVGIEENNVDLGIALFPNPTEGNVYVTMTATEQANITVFDAQGKVVSVMSNVQNGDIVDLNNVDKGIYVIKVSNTRGSNVFRIVKN